MIAQIKSFQNGILLTLIIFHRNCLISSLIKRAPPIFGRKVNGAYKKQVICRAKFNRIFVSDDHHVYNIHLMMIISINNKRYQSISKHNNCVEIYL